MFAIWTLDFHNNDNNNNLIKPIYINRLNKMGRKDIIYEAIYKEILCFIVDKEIAKSKEIAKKFSFEKNKSRSNLSMKLSALIKRKLIKKSENIPRAYEPNWEGILDYWLDHYFVGWESELFEHFLKKRKVDPQDYMFGFLKKYFGGILARKGFGFSTKERYNKLHGEKIKYWTYMSGEIVDLDCSFKTLKEIYFKNNLSKRQSNVGHYMFRPSDNFKGFLRSQRPQKSKLNS